jgi:hypothetical protein
MSTTKSVHRVNQSCTYANVESFINSAKELQKLVESGELSKDNVFVKFWGNPETIAKVSSIVPNDSLTTEELIGFDSYPTDVIESIKKALNKNVSAGKFAKRNLVAAWVAEASNPGWKEFDIQTQQNMIAASVVWVDANVCSEDDSSKLFVSKRGSGGGVSLRVSV